MAVEIRESSMVKPAEATPKHRLWLSNLDLLVVRRHVNAVRFYRRGVSDGPAFFSPDVLKDALSKALVPFYPLAGRLAQDSTDRLEIHCTGDGVLFVTALTDATIDDIAGSNLSDELQRMLVPSLEDGDRAGILAMFQVTFFRCGGVCLGSAVHHVAADGVAAISFLKTWAAVARGAHEATTPRPWVDRTLLRARSPPAVRFDHAEYPRRGGGSKTEIIPLDNIVLPLSRTQVNALKRSAGIQCKKVSTFDAVAAHAWRCACKARGLAGTGDSRLYMLADARSRLRPPLPAGYLGNAILRASAVAKVEDLTSEPLGTTADTISTAALRVDDEYIRSLVDYLEQVVSGDDDGAAELRLGRWVMSGTDLFLVSWLGLRSDDDFGWGRSSFTARATFTFNGLVYLDRSTDGDGGVDVTITMELESIARLKELFYEELNDHPLASQTQGTEAQGVWDDF
ncbi:Shikimate O-hydroxycinnamoyltransferase [Dichanthelium oligosanthes]|uniref:Shikimate O-hydroxycinnamoyltransferase n=1 Tax=Dichanthelium oligosanthes TaxID=888268 RepID=A0A1E5UTP2_9POAL|nr:Shikimate O-hydroxycinnamoyltransferase [Dichanthelium oligosanthes]